ncbi:MAG TPA: hypothetical protein VGS08_03985 [Candidatus Saccharimonadales bacterium]|nr:hypothetical protein [Candidatus Saccharimonadales bacterium]
MNINDLVDKLRKDFPDLSFAARTQAYWSPRDKHIFYKLAPKTDTAIWTLFHELGHALLKHDSYMTDIDLLRKEVAAWSKAEELAIAYGFTFNDFYVQKCLETYRNWIYKRSTCPRCDARGTQNQEKEYVCLNCGAHWSVSTSRFCRPYRGSNRHRNSQTTTKSQEIHPWLFVENMSPKSD